MVREVGRERRREQETDGGRNEKRGREGETGMERVSE